ncbi:MAG: hypothetical protein HY293_18090 [Planctomycetes bacterium]|nr:hypothetical protein [Planctomycetota bacterium]
MGTLVRVTPGRRRFLFLLALSLPFAFRAPPPEPPTSCKPTAPIDLEASLVGDPSAPFGVVARARSRNGAEVDLEILLPEGLTHLAGSRKLRGRNCEARIDLQAKDRRRREIYVCATISENGARLVRVLPLVIFDAPLPVPKARATQDARGQPILEFSP